MAGRISTRDRIVEEARQLYNAYGYGQITTAALSAHCGIAEGNLWYHFKTRRALLEAIARQFAESIEARLEMRPGAGGDPVADYARLLGAVMAEFRAFRFLYRDQPSYGEHAEVISKAAPDWIGRTYAQLTAHYAALVDAGLLDWPRDALHDLSVNATIILRYGLEHFRELGEPTGEGTGAVRRTLERHLTLFEHRLDPGAAARLHAALGAIEREALAA